MWTFVKAFLKNESGATAIEYALIGGLISISVVGGATAVGTSLSTSFNTIGGSF